MYKVLFLGWEYYPVFTGGLGIVCNAIAEELATQGLEIYVVVPSLPKNISASNLKFHSLNTTKLTTEFSNIKIKYSFVELNPYQNLQEHNYLNTLNFEQKNKINGFEGELYGSDLLSKVFMFSEFVKNLALEIEFDLIHAHDWMTFLGAIEAKNISGKKCVMHVHATELDRTADNPHDFILNLEKVMLTKADHVIAISEYTKQRLVTEYSIDTNKISVLHNALDDKHSHAVSNQLNLGRGKTVMFLGRAVVQKGVENFVYIAKRVLEKLPDTNFIFAGSGDLLNQVIELTCDLGISKNFIFTGGVDRLEGDILYKNSDLFLLTSISEPFGITALEAIRQDTPIIVSKTSGVSEVIPSALVVDFWDIDKYADYIVNLLSDQSLYNLIKENQQKDYEKLTWKTQVEKLIEVYSNLV